MTLISNNALILPATKQGSQSCEECVAQRDATQMLDAFERLAYEMTLNFALVLTTHVPPLMITFMAHEPRTIKSS